MYRIVTAMAALAFSALGATQGPRPTAQSPGEIRPHLKEERVTLVYTATANEATVVFEAQSEAQLERIDVRGPDGRSLLSLGADRGRGLALSCALAEQAAMRLDFELDGNLFRARLTGPPAGAEPGVNGRP